MPLVFMSDVGTMALNSEEAERLRKYLLRGGFLWVDDFWGEYAWDRWVEEITKALPQSEYPIEDLPAGHMIFNAYTTSIPYPRCHLSNIGVGAAGPPRSGVPAAPSRT